VSVDASLRLLSQTDGATGHFYAEDVDAMPPPRDSPREYSTGVTYFDFTQLWSADCGAQTGL